MLVDNKQTSRKDRECKSTGASYIAHKISTEETAGVKPLPTTDPSILGLAGYLVDTISTTASGEAWNDMSWSAGRLGRFLTQVDTLFDLAASTHSILPPLYDTEERRAEARWRVPVGDLYWTRVDGMRRATPETAVRHAQAVKALAFFDETARLDVAEQQRRFSEWDWTAARRGGSVGTFISRYEVYEAEESVLDCGGIPRHGAGGDAEGGRGGGVLWGEDSVCVEA